MTGYTELMRLTIPLPLGTPTVIRAHAAAGASRRGFPASNVEPALLGIENALSRVLEMR
jgi:hypothetical protein